MEELEKKYGIDFEIVRENALANPSLYGGRFTQEDEAEAYAEWKSLKNS